MLQKNTLSLVASKVLSISQITMTNSLITQGSHRPTGHNGIEMSSSRILIYSHIKEDFSLRRFDKLGVGNVLTSYRNPVFLKVIYSL